MTALFPSLRRKAEAATKGYWLHDEMSVGQQPRIYADGRRLLLACVGNAELGAAAEKEWESNAAFISAACNFVREDLPKVINALEGAAGALEVFAEKSRLKQLADSENPSSWHVAVTVSVADLRATEVVLAKIKALEEDK